MALRATPPPPPWLSRFFKGFPRWVVAGIQLRMREQQIFGLALGLAGSPWEVHEVNLDEQQGRLDIHLDFAPGSRFPHPLSGELASVYDTRPRTWRHLNFFQYECYLHAPVPRVDGGTAGGIKTASVPWARPESGFTLMMEAMIVLLSRNGMPVAKAARMVCEHAQRLWRVLFHHVDQAHDQIDLSTVRQLTVDETSIRRGHEYVTVVCEPGRKARGRRAATQTRVLFVTEGRDASTLERTREFFEQRPADPDRIQEICADMSPAYRKGIGEHFPRARLVFDYFHVIGLLTKAVDRIRRAESREFPELLKGTRYLWLKKEEKLKEEQRAQRDRLLGSKLKTAKAYSQLCAFQDLLQARQSQEAIDGLKWWCTWVMRSRLEPMKKVVRSIREHWEGIVAYLQTRLTNGPAEAINGIIQTAKRQARGFRSFEYFQTIIYLIGSKLSFEHLPSPIPVNPLHS